MPPHAQSVVVPGHDDDGENSLPLALAPMDVPLDPPPSYAVARVPEHPETYTFSNISISNSSMLLIPPRDAVSQAPLYYIAVGHYPFLPTCLITSVTKGSDEHGPYVGGFKCVTMMSGQESTRFGSQTVTIRGREHLLWQIFTKEPKRKGAQTFRWKPFGSSSRVLVWTCTKWPQPGAFTCYSDNKDSRTKVAEFTTITELLRPAASSQQPTLMIMPSGHAHFDDILISALLLERQRLLAVLNTGT
ncbi:hypothetical protein BDN70DRAFT_918971 [Pholiota conissans]|uniref:Uncharacterized protein n=1 Tax=Pholiota conissans TaxID=109636 RepID=A0A9P5Z9D1_9AGAR|nr:hypothetical protein BDN70DRAFT_918971 [Pholiota conissans]